MNLQKDLSKGKKEKSDKINLKEDNFQYNRQDLDQEQKVDMNPVQLNTQNVNVFVYDNSGKIVGTTYFAKNNNPANNIDILLYFSNINTLPVNEVKSNNYGSFSIENIPPGYYILIAKMGKSIKYQSTYIKLLPGNTFFINIPL